MTETENILCNSKHLLVCSDKHPSNLNSAQNSEFQYIIANFCGITIFDPKSLELWNYQPNTIIYLCGDIKKLYDLIRSSNNIINIIGNLSHNYESNSNYKIITSGQVPINIYNTGVYFRQFFSSNKNYFECINTEHKFQALTESTKMSDAFRTGIYLTKIESENDGLNFRLLRCSSNLRGPTDNFRDTDNEIIEQVNNVAGYFFEEKTNLNHVLAQIYNNRKLTVDSKHVERKAKIKAHSDKTKDMPRNGLMGFCTFYKDYYGGKFNCDELKHCGRSADNIYDYTSNNMSILTKLRFRLKNSKANSSLQKQFDVILYPNSVFITSLYTNRLYTHEIVPAGLPIDKLPTRLGYVIRCSKTEAVFRDNKTFIKDNDLVALKEPNEKGIEKLKSTYYEENSTDNIINYEQFDFSLNEGDYMKPIL